MSRSVNQVQGIFLAVLHVVHLDGVALDGDAALALQVHVVEHLGLHVLASHRVGDFKQSVGQCTLAVVDVRHNAEVAYCLHIWNSFILAAKIVKPDQNAKKNSHPKASQPPQMIKSKSINTTRRVPYCEASPRTTPPAVLSRIARHRLVHLDNRPKKYYLCNTGGPTAPRPLLKTDFTN